GGAAPVLRVRHLSKEFSGNRALSSVSLDVRAGEIHMLVGQNGSGKSTLIKVLAGLYLPEDGGRIEVDGQPLHFGRPDHAYHLGCRFVHQDLALVDDLNVLENLFLGADYPMRWGCIDNRGSRRVGREMVARVGLDVDLRAKVSELNASQRTGVAIARALRIDEQAPERVLVLDEPTATLPADEVSELLQTVRAAAAEGVAVLFVTHHLEEIFLLGDTVTILRDGSAVHAGSIAAITRAALVEHLTGNEDQQQPVAAAPPAAGRRVRLALEHVSAPGFSDVSLELGEGEIVGVAGITGSGREAVLGAVFGASRWTEGTVVVDGRQVPRGRPDLAIGMGVGYMPPDRKVSGSFPTLNAQDNLTLLNLGRFWRRCLLSPRAERREAATWFERLDVRPAGATRQVFESFSGGNQQKILFGKWLSRAPSVFLLDEPTQGVDIGAKAQLHRQLLDVAASGTSVLISSTDLDELVTVCTRVLVMAGGRVERELTGDALTVTNLTKSFVREDEEASTQMGAST
ncbi:MAG: sugar ABC transporter ATP-binding protein, partial [Acidimicrobiales bacterium]